MVNRINLMTRRALVALLLFINTSIAFGQNHPVPKIQIDVCGTAILDTLNGKSMALDSLIVVATNFNPSVSLSDTVISFVYDSLRSDGEATIVTVYETAEQGIVGLWELGTESNRALWLNSQKVSYEDYGVRYRPTTETGVIIHTMRYKYPEMSDSINCRDTLFVGREGNHWGNKRFCAMRYYKGAVSHNWRRKIESALAIRFGALLQGPYVNSHSDTLWNPAGADSTFSFGICGIGRDDSMSLFQPQSVVHNSMEYCNGEEIENPASYIGALTLSFCDTLSDMRHVMLGGNMAGTVLNDEVERIDTSDYMTIDRRWKIRSNTYGHSAKIRIIADLPLPANAARLMLVSASDTSILRSSSNERIVFDSIIIEDKQDYYLSILVSIEDLIKRGAKDIYLMASDAFLQSSLADHALSVTPNPTTGHFTVSFHQAEEDYVDLKIVDVNGSVIEHITTSGKLTSYTYSGYIEKTGVFYITVSSNGIRRSAKLVVIR